MRPLGRRQQGVLTYMGTNNFKTWFGGCGWSWGTETETDEIMRSLEKRGLVRLRSGYGITAHYELTDEGKQLAWKLSHPHGTVQS